VSEFLLAVASAFGVVFLAELGDKTQLLALTFGARYPFRVVALGMALGYAVAGALAAIVGGLLGAALPEEPIALAGGVVFLVFAALALRDAMRPEHEQDEDTHVVRARSVVISIALTIAVAEFGDKTQLATATLAARGQPFATWIGATAGVLTAGLIGAFAGSVAGTKIPERAQRYASAAMFAFFGVLLIISAL